jgi:hypothetical protein
LEFLIPIPYPGKPTRVTVTVANTIFGGMEERVVHWGRILALVVTKLTDQVKKNKYSPLSPYLFYLYRYGEVLTPEEVTIYETGCKLLKYGLTHELQEDQHEGEEEEEEHEEPEEKESMCEPPICHLGLTVCLFSIFFNLSVVLYTKSPQKSVKPK